MGNLYSTYWANHWHSYPKPRLLHLNSAEQPGDGHSVLLAGNQWSPLQPSQTNNGRATDSCFTLIGAHQCGWLMCVLGWLAAYVSTTSATNTYGSTKADRETTVYGLVLGWWGVDHITWWGDTYWANHWRLTQNQTDALEQCWAAWGTITLF